MNNSNLPVKLYKYYSCNGENEQRIEARLKGEIFFSSPLNFNDPYDCQLPKINNNTATFSKGKSKILGLLLEEGFNPEETYEKLISDDKETIREVYRRQADLLGILCLTQQYDNILMWSHYAHNNGICIEYNTEKLLEYIYLTYRGRMFADDVVYDRSLKSNSKLFFEDVIDCKLKYWHKLRQWKYEKEFRIGVSLGGNVAIRIPNMVKHIYLGCNCTIYQVAKIWSLCQKNRLDIPISIMRKTSLGLKPFDIPQYELDTILDRYGKEDNLFWKEYETLK